MKKGELDNILKKIGAQEEDILSIGETWALENVLIDGINEKVRAKFKYYDIILKNRDVFYLKMNHLTKDIKGSDEIGYDLMGQ